MRSVYLDGFVEVAVRGRDTDPGVDGQLHHPSVVAEPERRGVTFPNGTGRA